MSYFLKSLSHYVLLKRIFSSRCKIVSRTGQVNEVRHWCPGEDRSPLWTWGLWTWRCIRSLPRQQKWWNEYYSTTSLAPWFPNFLISSFYAKLSVYTHQFLFPKWLINFINPLPPPVSFIGHTLPTISDDVPNSTTWQVSTIFWTSFPRLSSFPRLL